MDDAEKAISKTAPSIFHQISKGILAYVAGFAMQKLVENAYDQFLTSRHNKEIKTD